MGRSKKKMNQGAVVKDSLEDPRMPLIQTIDHRKICRNVLDSRNFVESNPDITNLHVYSCYCGMKLDLRSDWHTMLYDGTVLCLGCSKCGRCGKEAQLDKKCVCLEGMVLCYRCLCYYGYELPSKKIKYIETIDPTDNAHPMITEEDDDSLNNLNNMMDNNTGTQAVTKETEYELPRVLRSEDRRPLRLIPYKIQQPIPDESIDRRITAPNYTGSWNGLVIMTCPACDQRAIKGPSCYVVPSIGRVYHRDCFKCCSCQADLSVGIKFAHKDYNYCNCLLPKVFCMLEKCQKERYLHHDENKCVLGSERPGGRDQCFIMGSDPLVTMELS